VLAEGTHMEIITGGKRAGHRQSIRFRLYVTNRTPRTLNAIENIRSICKRHAPGRYRIEVIDLRRHPQLAREDMVFATPTLVRMFPMPRKMTIGDLSDSGKVLTMLDIPLRQ
jgi:circadian clock protein KaiB